MKIKRFIKAWTLPFAMLTGALLYFIGGFTPGLCEITSPVLEFVQTIFPFLMSSILFVTFCKIDFRNIRFYKWHLFICSVQTIMVVVLVFLTFFFKIKDNSLIVIEGVIACVICPTATAAAVVTQKLGGHLESMIAYTALSNVLSSFLVSLFFPFLACCSTDNLIFYDFATKLISPPSNGVLFTQVVDFTKTFSLLFYKVSLVLIIPIFCSFIVRTFFHKFHTIIVSVRDLSYYLWAISLSIITGLTLHNIVKSEGESTSLLGLAIGSLVICLLQFCFGRMIGGRYKARLEAGQALGQKNTIFAIWLAGVYLSPLSAIGPGFYIIWQNIINSLEIHKYSLEQRS